MVLNPLSRLIISFSLFLVFILPAFCADNATADGLYKQTIAKGDLLYVEVIGHKDLDTEVVVNNGGTIQFPLVGEIYVVGKTLSEFAIELEKTLVEFIRFPKVMVKQHNTFFVYGEVNKPGEYKLEGHISDLKAVVIAGGFTDFGSHRIKIIKRRGSTRKDKWVNVDKIINDKGEDKDVLVEPGDVIVVPESLF